MANTSKAVTKKEVAKADVAQRERVSKQLKAEERQVEADERVARIKSKKWKKELRGKETRFGKEQLSFTQLEGGGRVQDVFAGQHGEPVFSTVLGAFDKPERERPGDAEKAPIKAQQKRCKAAKKTKKESQGARNKGRAERRQWEFEAVAEELDQMAVAREWAEQLEQAERARQAAQGMEQDVLGDTPKQEAAAVLAKVLGQRAVKRASTPSAAW